MGSSTSPIPRPLVTGATGFVGRALAQRLGSPATLSLSQPGWHADLAARDLRDATVVHLAARVHEAGASEAVFSADNVDKTRDLAEAAAAGGAARFVFASTIKVFGEESGAKPFVEQDEPAPEGAYAKSKWRAEQALREISARTGLALVILRFPLVYGRGAGGNFRALVRLADTGWWLPFGAIANRRSLVNLDDLVDAIVLAGSHRAAPGGTFAVAHPEAISTPRLVVAIRQALGRPSRLFAAPTALLETGASLAGLGERMRRLTRSLEVDPTAMIRDLGWSPRFGLEDGIGDCLRGNPS